MKKKKPFIYLCLLCLGILLFSYIGSCNKIINKDTYLNIAWDYIDHDKTIIDWKKGQVSLVKLGPDSFIYQRKILERGYYSNRINRLLLILNGNNVINVTFETSLDNLLGSEVVFINPFTKSVIGENVRY